MFDEKVRESRRGGRQMPPEELDAFLRSIQYGTLSYLAEEGWPDARPMNFGYYNGCLYFHAAKNKGEKLAHWKDGAKVCVSAFEALVDINEKRFGAHHSVLIYGQLERLDDKPDKAEEAFAAMTAICMGGRAPSRAAPENIKNCIHGVGIFKVVPTHSVGKITRFSSIPEILQS